MQLFRYSTSIYGGSDVLIGASWDLLKWFVLAGAVAIVLHAAIKAVTSRGGQIGYSDMAAARARDRADNSGRVEPE